MQAKLTVSIVAATLLTTIQPVQAQQQAKIPTIGWLGAGVSNNQGSGRESFRRELVTLGYVEGKNIACRRSTLGRITSLAAA